MGIFNPENAQMALITIEMMEFEGKDKVIEYIKQGQTLMNVIEQQKQIMAQQQQQLMMLQGQHTAFSQPSVTAADVGALRA